MLNTLNDIKKYFEQRKAFGIKPGLARVQYLLAKLGHPEKDLCAVHVAGTNGKGSTIQFIHDGLVANDYKVGVFTSPSFTGIQGHMLINGKEITEGELLTQMKRLLPYVEMLDERNNHPTSFEIITVLAIAYFAEQTDIALIETGMGGTEDTTNVIIPAISIITNVSKDHMDFLGESLEEITSHKAGIIKSHRPVVIGKVNGESSKIIQTTALEKKAPTYALQTDFFYTQKKNDTYEWSTSENVSMEFRIKMAGDHQLDNAAIALMALQLLESQGKALDWSKVSDSLAHTQLPGRFEEISAHPTIILDSAHNIAGIEAFTKTVQRDYKQARKHLLFAGFKDKQLREMVGLLSDAFPMITFTTFDHERAASMTEICEFIESDDLRITEDWQHEVMEIMQNDRTDELYFITGSLHFITLVRQFIVDVRLSENHDEFKVKGNGDDLSYRCSCLQYKKGCGFSCGKIDSYSNSN